MHPDVRNNSSAGNIATATGGPLAFALNSLLLIRRTQGGLMTIQASIRHGLWGN
jgi:hypothetical protein